MLYHQATELIVFESQLTFAWQYFHVFLNHQFVARAFFAARAGKYHPALVMISLSLAH